MEVRVRGSSRFASRQRRRSGSKVFQELQAERWLLGIWICRRGHFFAGGETSGMGRDLQTGEGHVSNERSGSECSCREMGRGGQGSSMFLSFFYFFQFLELGNGECFPFLVRWLDSFLITMIDSNY